MAVLILAKPQLSVIQEHGFEKVGDIVQNIPTAVSHQSSTVVHQRADVRTPVVAPVVKSRFATQPYTTLVRSYAPYPAYHYPLGFYYDAPYSLEGYYGQQLYKSLI